ncbi:alpha/beta hydrolase [Streptomyces sp. NPDC051954]|uniref:alpha/beta hydrolase n=1 Tax=Streptomyces sp. NPDC051954 TaxID=3155524 RepID=UPI00341458B3
MPIDPNLIRTIAALGVPVPALSTDPREQRARAFQYEQAVYPHLGPTGPRLPVREHVIPVTGRPDVLVRLYYPREPTADLSLPACLHFYGGAFIQGGLHHPSVDAMCALRAARAGVVVAAVSYALAPEHPYPTALEQGWAALDWLVREAGSLGVDPTRIALAGQSAGGTLVAALTQLNRDRARHPLSMQILEVPAVDLALGPRERGVEGLTEEQLAHLEMSLAWYVPRAGDRLDPLVSPLRAKSFEGLPPAYVFTAECDPLRDDGEAYAAALADAGVPVAALRMLGLPHEGGMYERVSGTARLAQAAVAETLRTLHD